MSILDGVTNLITNKNVNDAAKAAQNLANEQSSDFKNRSNDIQNMYTGMNNQLQQGYSNYNKQLSDMYAGMNNQYQSAMDNYKQNTDANIAAIDRSFDRSDDTSRANMLAMGFNPDASDVFARNEAAMANERATAKEDVLNRANQNMFNASQQSLGAQSNLANSQMGMMGNSLNSMYSQMANNMNSGYGMGNELYTQGNQISLDAANANTAQQSANNQAMWGNIMGAAKLAAAPLTGGASLAM